MKNLKKNILKNTWMSLIIANLLLAITSCKGPSINREPAFDKSFVPVKQEVSEIAPSTNTESTHSLYSSTFREPMSIKEASQVTKLPALPILLQGCEGACCGKLENRKVKKDLVIYSNTDSQRPVTTLKQDEEMKETQFFIKVSRLGKAISDGKSLDLLNYVDDGKWFAWVNGKAELVDGLDNDDEQHKIIKEPITESWVQIKTQKGDIGWAKLPAKNFGDASVLNYVNCE